MKKKVKKIVLLTVAALCCGAVVVGGAWCSAQVDSSPCKEVCVVIEDSLERQFVDIDELEGYLKRNGLYPKGQSMEQIDCHAIEQCILAHDMVRKVGCYKSPFGCVYVRLTQRVPVLCVVANDGCYYVDSDRKVMPARKRVDVEVPVFRGAVSTRAATEEYYDFVMWLQENHYWCDVITDVNVQTPRHLVLTQAGQSAKIVLGTLDGYVDKLARLKKLYTHGLAKIEHPAYREYDLRYEGQVVGRK